MHNSEGFIHFLRNAEKERSQKLNKNKDTEVDSSSLPPERMHTVVVVGDLSAQPCFYSSLAIFADGVEPPPWRCFNPFIP